MAAGAESRVRVASLADLAPGSTLLVEVEGRRICLARTHDGDVYAVDDTCTHEEESLSEGWVEGNCIECPAHNSIFDLRTGEALSLPAEDPVATHAVAVEGEEILLTLSDS